MNFTEQTTSVAGRVGLIFLSYEVKSYDKEKSTHRGHKGPSKLDEKKY